MQNYVRENMQNIENVKTKICNITSKICKIVFKMICKVCIPLFLHAEYAKQYAEYAIKYAKSNMQNMQNNL